MISLQDEDPKKKAEGEKKATKAEKSKEATKGSDCTHEKKAKVQVRRRVAIAPSNLVSLI